MEDCFIFDVEGTLSNHSDRLQYIPSNDADNWKKFQSEFIYDPTNPVVVEIYKSLYGSHRIIISTGMPETMRSVLESWLTMNNIALPSEIYMRHTGIHDGVSSPALKMKHLVEIRSHGFNPIGVFDDRLDVCEAFKEKGIQAFHLPFQGFVSTTKE